MAVNNGHADLVRMLLDGGANARIGDMVPVYCIVCVTCVMCVLCVMYVLCVVWFDAAVGCCGCRTCGHGRSLHVGCCQ